MLYEQKLSGSVILWPPGKPKDRLEVPTEPAILALLAQHECTCLMGHDGAPDEIGFNCYEIINKHGDALHLRFGALLSDWKAAIEQVARHRE